MATWPQNILDFSQDSHMATWPQNILDFSQDSHMATWPQNILDFSQFRINWWARAILITAGNKLKFLVCFFLVKILGGGDRITSLVSTSCHPPVCTLDSVCSSSSWSKVYWSKCGCKHRDLVGRVGCLVHNGDAIELTVFIWCRFFSIMSSVVLDKHL